MRVRVAELTGDNSESRSFMPFLGTFHGICVRLLRQNGDSAGIDKNFVIYDEADRLNLIKQLMAREHIDDKQSPPRAIASIISGAKNEMLSPTSSAVQLAVGPKDCRQTISTLRTRTSANFGFRL